ncbi:hypothetical protein L484_026487 [Morus notabilis]|uniref:Uncharacterized protein n=1 Tax=Morus notabilis TaxID=981085 RepID=W9RAN8_9ROSA|nr:hypothetical protein L484_026487 [Morus notabilis]
MGFYDINQEGAVVARLLPPYSTVVASLTLRVNSLHLLTKRAKCTGKDGIGPTGANGPTPTRLP